MKISILLPYKENFSPDYPGAVSLFVYETTKISKYRSSIKVYGNTEFKNKFKLNYINIDLKKKLFYNKFLEVVFFVLYFLTHPLIKDRYENKVSISYL